MAALIITHRERDLGVRLPYQILLNGTLVGIMTTPQAMLRMPAGTYSITIRFGTTIPISKKGKTLDLSLSTTQNITVHDSQYTCLDFHNNERWWDIIFTIDLIAWFILLFITLPSPWNIVYHILSDGFFIAWLIRLFVVRKRYFAFRTSYTSTPPSS